MGMLGRFILELVRILALLIIVVGVSISLITSILNSFGIEVTVQVKGLISFISFIIFYVWYRKRGQHTGWYRANVHR